MPEFCTENWGLCRVQESGFRFCGNWVHLPQLANNLWCRDPLCGACRLARFCYEYLPRYVVFPSNSKNLVSYRGLKHADWKHRLRAIPFLRDSYRFVLLARGDFYEEEIVLAFICQLTSNSSVRVTLAIGVILLLRAVSSICEGFLAACPLEPNRSDENCPQIGTCPKY